MIGADWTPHRREDGELVGWIRPEGELWVPIDLLGRERGAPMEWLDAEAVLEDAGLGYLAEPWMLDGVATPDGAEGAVRVRFVEVTPDRIVVKGEDFGAVDAPVGRWELSWPLPPQLREPRADDPDPFVSFG
ncbi:MAG: hypothetical protein EOO67_16855 [Microbacterium sp.]|nr:MAG: hypothetical protein EOO67_16855 [Microbacterium sp.]